MISDESMQKKKSLLGDIGASLMIPNSTRAQENFRRASAGAGRASPFLHPRHVACRATQAQEGQLAQQQEADAHTA